MLGSFALITVIGCVVLWSFCGFRYNARPSALQLNPPLAEYIKGLEPRSNSEASLQALA
jgi:hypothetical protein